MDRRWKREGKSWEEREGGQERRGKVRFVGARGDGNNSRVPLPFPTPAGPDSSILEF